MEVLLCPGSLIGRGAGLKAHSPQRALKLGTIEAPSGGRVALVTVALHTRFHGLHALCSVSETDADGEGLAPPVPAQLPGPVSRFALYDEGGKIDAKKCLTHWYLRVF